MSPCPPQSPRKGELEIWAWSTPLSETGGLASAHMSPRAGPSLLPEAAPPCWQPLTLPLLQALPLPYSSLGEGSSLAEGFTYSQEGAGLDPVKASEDKTWWAGTNPCSG